MKIENPYDFGLKRYKGNLHTHCKNDNNACGQWALEDVVKIYKEKGYDFLAITNHYIMTDVSSAGGDDFLMIPGQEIHPTAEQGNALPNGYHILGLGIAEAIGEVDTPQHAIDAVNRQGAASVVCHPNWCYMTNADLDESIVKDFAATEVYNGVCEKSRGRGLSDTYWDYMLSSGRKVWALGVDDAHEYPEDAGKAWIILFASNLSVKSVLESIRRGAFYASEGPDFENIEVNGGKLRVKIRNGYDIRFIGAGGRLLKDTVGGMQLEGDYEIKGDEKYIRIEVSDRVGRRAWSNPLFLSQ